MGRYTLCCLAHYRGRKGGQSLLLPVPHCPTSHTFCAPLSHDSHPSLCCSCLQVNKEDQKLRFNFQIVPKLNILVHFLAFILAGGSLGSNESYYKFHLTATAYQTLKYKCTCVMCQERKLKKLTQTHQLQICIFLPPKCSFKHRWMLNGNFKTLLDILTE